MKTKYVYIYNIYIHMYNKVVRFDNPSSVAQNCRDTGDRELARSHVLLIAVDSEEIQFA